MATAQGRLAAAGQWALNEKGLVERAGLAHTRALLDGVDGRDAAAALADFLQLPAWR